MFFFFFFSLPQSQFGGEGEWWGASAFPQPNKRQMLHLQGKGDMMKSNRKQQSVCVCVCAHTPAVGGNV